MSMCFDRKVHIQRARKVNMLRLWYWLKSIPRKPWTLLPVLLTAIAFIWIWNSRHMLIPQPENSLLSITFRYSIPVSIVLCFLLLFSGNLLLISSPFHARRYESALLQICLVSSMEMPPSLIARLPIKNTNAYRLVFYSLGISMSEWNTRKGDIEDALNLHYVESPQYGGRNGNNRNIIVLTVAPGVNKTNQEVLYDDSL